MCYRMGNDRRNRKHYRPRGLGQVSVQKLCFQATRDFLPELLILIIFDLLVFLMATIIHPHHTPPRSTHLCHATKIAILTSCMVYQSPRHQLTHAIVKIHRRPHRSREIKNGQYGCDNLFHGNYHKAIAFSRTLFTHFREIFVKKILHLSNLS